jgi:hypothetical protein
MDEAVEYLERDLDKLCQSYTITGAFDRGDGLHAYMTLGGEAARRERSGVSASSPMFSVRDDHPEPTRPNGLSWWCTLCDGQLWTGAPGQQREHVGGSHP